VIRELLDAGLLHGDIACVHGGDLRQQATQPWLDDLSLRWRTAPATSLDENVVRGVAARSTAKAACAACRATSAARW
jgi:phosphogluconate dehydratase